MMTKLARILQEPIYSMLSLNLPSFDHKVIRKENKLFIFDILRKKYVFLTPEEWVRQHLIHFLINQHQYPKALMRVEGGLYCHGLPRRTDLVVYDRTGKPFALVECKDSDVPLTAEVFEQAARYNHVLKAPYLILANGLEYRCYRSDSLNASYQVMEDLPACDC
jgi:hypothetical protein